MRRLRNLFRAARVARGVHLGLLEVSGFAAIVAGVALIYVPAALIVAGAATVAAAYALDRGRE